MGADVVAVVMGSASQAARFAGERELPYRCVADPDRSAFAAFGLTTAGLRSWLANRNVVVGGLRLFRRGVGAGLPHPGQDIRQMPGTFVVSASGVVRYAHYSADAADIAPVDAVLGVLGA